MTLNKKGFSAIEGLLAVIAVALVFFVGFYVLNQNKSIDKVNSKSSDTEASIAKPTSKSTVDPVIYKSSDLSLYSMSLIAKTSDQRQQAKALDANCKTSNTNLVAVTAEKTLFTTSGSSYITGKDAVLINTLCYDPKDTYENQQPVSGALHLLKKQNNAWTFISATQQEFDCKLIDNSGFAGKITDCYDKSSETLRPIK